MGKVCEIQGIELLMRCFIRIVISIHFFRL